MNKIENTKYYSKKIGELADGCKMCVKGEKLVLYITGICPRKCWYCPLSENRKNIDIIYANETKISEIDEVIAEAKISQAKGAGITGGDPLAKIDRTTMFIKKLKETFGKNFHIHLYTTFIYSNEENFEKLYFSGLDEIRFHPDFNNKNHWKRIDKALKYGWDVGIEIPVLPNLENETIEMVEYFADKNIKFINLNELEIAETNVIGMDKENYEPKKDISPGVKGSQKLANKILKLLEYKQINVHYCPSKLKDKVQMLNRYKLRAKNVSTQYDIITSEGLLIKGCIYIKEADPRKIKVKKLNEKEKNKIFQLLEIKKKYFDKEDLETIIDLDKLRFETYPEHVEQFSKLLKKEGFIPAIIEEDPTSDRIEINRHFL